jgi:ABC-2 type transport system ATP-binding protein
MKGTPAGGSLPVMLSDTAVRRREDPPEISTEPAISVTGLRMSFGSTEALRGVDLEVGRGEIFALLGPNGAGKTTTIEILEGFTEASSGTVRVLGENPATAPLSWRSRLGVVLQESATEPELTVRECLELYGGYYAHPIPVERALSLSGLTELAERRSGRLSGGERRRLDVALALIGDPELVFLDEPTTGFDPSARRASWDVIDGLRSLGKTIVLTTHYMEEAERLADRIAVLVEGRVAAVGTPETIGSRDHAGAQLRFPLSPATVDLPPQLAARVEVQGTTATLSTADLARDLNLLTGWALDRGVPLDGLEIARSSLEDVYIQLTTHDERSR